MFKLYVGINSSLGNDEQSREFELKIKLKKFESDKEGFPTRNVRF